MCNEKDRNLWLNHNWLLLQDNAPAHTSLKTTEFVTNNNIVIVPHPPYTPDLAPCDFLLFPKLKMKLKGRHFETSKGNRKRYSTALRKMTSTVLSKRGKNDWIAVYVPKETVLKEMAAKIE
jgi:transposase